MRAAGIEPAFQAWKACILAFVLCPQRIQSRSIIYVFFTKASVYYCFQILPVLIFFNFSINVFASDLDNALRATYMACVGIDDELADLKKMAGINTAISAVGTATATGALIKK